MAEMSFATEILATILQFLGIISRQAKKLFSSQRLQVKKQNQHSALRSDTRFHEKK